VKSYCFSVVGIEKVSGIISHLPSPLAIGHQRLHRIRQASTITWLNYHSAIRTRQYRSNLAVDVANQNSRPSGGRDPIKLAWNYQPFEFRPQRD
jgi:hypothetical protein